MEKIAKLGGSVSKRLQKKSHNGKPEQLVMKNVNILLLNGKNKDVLYSIKKAFHVLIINLLS